MPAQGERPIRTRDDVLVWMERLLPADFDYCAGAAAAYPDEIRRLEALLRPLWGLLPVRFGPAGTSGTGAGPAQPVSCSEQGIARARLATKAQLYIHELRRRVELGELPQVTTENRQIAVETGVLSYALARYRARFLELFSEKGRSNLVSWLGSINDIEFPAGNWYFFLAFVNAALRSNGLPYSGQRLDEALAGIDSFAQGRCWYTDGPGHQLDHYVGFAFHFYGMLYAAHFADGDDDPYAAVFSERAVAFAEDFRHWFDDEGRSLPFGRSLTYRFAHVSFWSALVATGLYERSSLPLGEIKGIILRNLRFWQRRPIAAPHEDNLFVGYGYDQPLMAEDYNAPGSPMWAFKAFVLLDLPAGHAFWQAEEKPMARDRFTVQTEPGLLISSSPRQTTALSVRQDARDPQLYRAAEKYGKFAYSTYFGFNVGRGPVGLEQFAIDSALAFSVAGHDQYASRTTIDHCQTWERYGLSRWRLWGSQVCVRTFLVPINAGSHIRVHLVDNCLPVDVAEGGFPLHDWNRKYDHAQLDERRAAVDNRLGSSSIEDLLGDRAPVVIGQGPNTNLYCPEKNAVPALVTNLEPGHHVLACLVVGEPAAQNGAVIGGDGAPDTVDVRIGSGRIDVSWDGGLVEMNVGSAVPAT